MEIHAYLRASTAEQDPLRAKDALINFATQQGHHISNFYVERISGAKLERPELLKLLENAKTGDVILIEQVDRLTRLSAENWNTLKAVIESKGIMIVSIDLPTSFAVLTPSQSDDFTKGILGAINGMMLDILATTARKDYEDRRRRQAQGIKIAQAQGKFTGRKQTPEMRKKLEEAYQLHTEHNLSKEKASKVAGVGVASFYRYLKTL